MYEIDKNKYWILEYSWPDINENSVKYVLNGFMYSLVCLKMTSQIAPNFELDGLFNYGWNGLKHKIDEYYFKGTSWTKYDLNPTIEPPHYAIFDLALLESLAISGKEQWVENTLAKRRSILKNPYKIDVAEKNINTYKVNFSLIGPPNPYWIDTYPIEIKINYTDGEQTVLNSFPPKDFEMDIFKRGFISFDLEKAKFFKISTVVVSSEYLGQRQQLFTYTRSELKKIL